MAAAQGLPSRPKRSAANRSRGQARSGSALRERGDTAGRRGGGQAPVVAFGLTQRARFFEEGDSPFSLIEEAAERRAVQCEGERERGPVADVAAKLYRPLAIGKGLVIGPGRARGARR